MKKEFLNGVSHTGKKHSVSKSSFPSKDGPGLLFLMAYIINRFGIDACR